MVSFKQFLLEAKHEYQFAKPNPDSARVHLHLAHTDQDITTASGRQLHAQAGQHYIVSKVDNPNDKSVIRKDIGDSVYQKHENHTYSKKTDLVYPFRIAGRRQTIHSLEGPVSAKKGDKIMLGTVGEQWPINPEAFSKRYLTVHPDDHHIAIKSLTHHQKKALNYPMLESSVSKPTLPNDDRLKKSWSNVKHVHKIIARRVIAGTAIGAGLGGYIGGLKGAAIGGLIGAGGTAIVHAPASISSLAGHGVEKLLAMRRQRKSLGESTKDIDQLILAKLGRRQI